MSIPATPSRDESDLDTLRDEIRSATELLERIIADRGLLAADSAGGASTGFAMPSRLVYHPDAKARRTMVKATTRQRKAAAARKEEEVLEERGIRSLRRQSVFNTPNVFPPEQFEQTDVDDPDFRETVEERHCYVCKEQYSTLHHFYDQLCPACGDFNFAKRTELADLTGRTALLTGGRVKIGYQAGLKLLRAGARLIVTTRFPRDSAARYSREPDFEQWAHRLEIFGLDLRHTPSVEAFCHELLASHDRLDFIVNNACQTVRRPPAFYEHMMEGERASVHALPEHARRLLGRYEGLRGESFVGGTTAGALTAGTPSRDSETMGLVHAAALSQVALLAEDDEPRRISFRRAGSIRICSRSICASATPGACCSPTCRPSSCSRCSSSTPSRPSCSTRGSSRSCCAPPSATSTSSTSRRWRGSSTATRRRRAPAHQHGEGRAQHDDAHVGGRVLARRHPHEQRGHRLGDRRGSGRDRGAEGEGAPVPSAAGHRGWRGADRGSHHEWDQHGGARVGEVPEGLRATDW